MRDAAVTDLLVLKRAGVLVDSCHADLLMTAGVSALVWIGRPIIALRGVVRKIWPLLR